MKERASRYFAGVRWVELALVVGIATLGDLQLKAQSGSKLDQAAWIEALFKGLGAALIYLRVPKGEEMQPAVSVDGLPAGVDATGPADDIHSDQVVEVVEAALPPLVSAAAPELAGNIVGELRRVLRRGIRL